MNFPGGDPTVAMAKLSTMIKELTERPAGPYRIEDLISAAAAFAGENILGQVDGSVLSDHQFRPGSPLFSEKANSLLSGSSSDWAAMPHLTAFARLYSILPHHPKFPYPYEAFPSPDAVYRHFAARRRDGVVSKEDWGTASLTIPTAHWPQKPPLRSAYELRQAVSRLWGNDEPTPAVLCELAQLCLTQFLVIARTTKFSPSFALVLAMETLNAMAKTAPMLPKHLPAGLRPR